MIGHRCCHQKIWARSLENSYYIFIYTLIYIYELKLNKEKFPENKLFYLRRHYYSIGVIFWSVPLPLLDEVVWDEDFFFAFLAFEDGLAVGSPLWSKAFLSLVSMARFSPESVLLSCSCSCCWAVSSWLLDLLIFFLEFFLIVSSEVAARGKSELWALAVVSYCANSETEISIGEWNSGVCFESISSTFWRSAFVKAGLSYSTSDSTGLPLIKKI